MNKPSPIYLMSQSGNVYFYNWSEFGCLEMFSIPPRGMGLTLTGDGHMAVGNKNEVRVLDGDGEQKFDAGDERYGFHHIKPYGEKLLVAATGRDEIIVLSADLEVEDVINLQKLLRGHVVDGFTDFYHANAACYRDGLIYVDLNHYYGEDRSGVLVLDESYDKVDEFQFGWETHGLTRIDGSLYALCGNSWKDLNHPYRAGLFVDGELVFDHDPNEVFCKDFSVDEDYIYLVGGDVCRRSGRTEADSVLFLLDRDFNLLEKKVFDGKGDFAGCLLSGEDLTL